MADTDVVDISVPDEPEGSVQRRARAFISRLGISELAYSQVLEDAITHANAARPAAPPAGQSWSPVGPRNVCGRILALAQDPTNELTYYAGTAHGGLWRSIDGGDTWEQLGQAEHIFPVATIAIHEQAPTVLYIGTGSPLESQVSGRGLYEVTVPGPRLPAAFRRLVGAPPPAALPSDADARAETRGSALRYGRIRIDPEDPKCFWAASQSGLWRCELHGANPQFRLDFPPGAIDSGDPPPPVPSALDANGRFPAYATDLVVELDPRDRSTMGDGGPRRFLVLYLGIQGQGVYRGRFDRENREIKWEKKLAVPVSTPAVTGTGTVGAVPAGNPAFSIVTLVPAAGGTRFTRLFKPGDLIEAPLGGATRQVVLIFSDTQLACNAFPAGAVPAGSSFGRAAQVPPFAGIRVAACERQPQRLYAIMEQQSAQPTPVYRSDDSGEHWRIAAEFLGPGQGQAFYNLVLEVNPTQPDLLVCGLLDVFLSRDGGSSWRQILVWQDYNVIGDYAQHADQHAAMFDRFDRRRLWIGNDGGVSVSRDLQLEPRSPAYWRARGHGILGGQFQDVSMHPTPALAMFSGGGLQDNGSWVSYGGPTWVHVGWADGGYFGFDPANPRRYLFSQQNAQTTGTVVAPLPPPNLVNPIVRDVPEALAPLQAMGVTIGVVPAPPGFLVGNANNSPFVPVVAQDPGTPNQFIFGWRQAGGAGADTGAYSSINAGATAVPLAQLAVPSALVPNNADCTAACFGPTIGGNAEGWIGFDSGALIRTATAPVGPWVAPATALPAAAAGQPISRVLVHPGDERIVVVCTIGSNNVPAPQGRVCISYDRGLSWQDLTARTPASVTVTPAAPAMPVGTVSQFTATAAFADGSSFDATASVTWTSSVPARGTFSTKVGEEGQFTAVAAGNTTATASFAAIGGAVTGNTVVTVNAGAAGAAPPLPAAPRQFDLPSLPRGPLTSLELEQIANPTRLFAGTLAGVYVLTGLPCPTAVTIGNASPLNLPLGHTVQLTASLTMTSGPAVVATTEVDWSAAPGGIVTFGAAPRGSQITGAALGPTVVTARRGIHSITINVNVVAAAPPIPPLPPVPAAMVAPVVAVSWAPFNAGLPLVLVNEITHSAAAGANLLRIATFGRGVWDCNLAAPAVAQNLFIRQMPIDDGRMARAVPAGLTADPRLPAPPATVGLDFTHAFDIRVDAPPYQFFDDRVDGVEFDERLGADTLHPTKPNAIYVQVHNNGRSQADDVQLHLYFRASPAAAPMGPPPGAAVPALGAVAEFYNSPSFDPTGGGDPVAGATWTRVAPMKEIKRIRPGEPVVTRFDWTPPPALAGQNIALLALCGSKAGQDALPAAAAAAPGINLFVAAERRAALRVLAVDPLPLPDLYLRAAVDDDGLAAGASTSLLRSPDIVVSPGAPASPPATAFRDLLDARPQDHLQAGQANHLYVRVHNRGAALVHAEVQLFAVRVGADLQPDTNNANWIRITPAAPAKLEVDVPANGWVLAETSWTPVDPAAGDRSFILLALVASADANDPLPAIGAVNSPAAFAALLSRPAGSNNVAARAVRLRS